MPLQAGGDRQEQQRLIEAGEQDDRAGGNRAPGDDEIDPALGPALALAQVDRLEHVGDDA